jgi:hypothetical protein
MNPPDATRPMSDERLRDKMRDSLARTPGTDGQALEARVLAQWRQHSAATARRPQGALAVLQHQWRQHPALWSTAFLVLGVAVVLLKPWVQPDPALDELMQLDVLSLMAAGEL